MTGISRGCGTAGSRRSAPGRRANAGRLYRENWIEWDELARRADRGVPVPRDRLRARQLARWPVPRRPRTGGRTSARPHTDSLGTRCTAAARRDHTGLARAAASPPPERADSLGRARLGRAHARPSGCRRRSGATAGQAAAGQRTLPLVDGSSDQAGDPLRPRRRGRGSAARHSGSCRIGTGSGGPHHLLRRVRLRAPGVGRVLLLAGRPQFYAAGDAGAPTAGTAPSPASYQFGFQDSYYDPSQQQSAEWDEDDQVPQLLWLPGRRGPPGLVPRAQRRVPAAAAIDLGVGRSRSPAERRLIFLGRAGDSLTSRSAAARRRRPGRRGPVGARLPVRPARPDEAVALPQVLAPPRHPPRPYRRAARLPVLRSTSRRARICPRVVVRAALAVAGTLRAHCGFERALRWYRLPSTRCSRTAPGCTARRLRPRSARRASRPQAGPCCDSTDGLPARRAPGTGRSLLRTTCETRAATCGTTR